MTDEPTNPAGAADDGLDARLSGGFHALARAAGDPPPLPDAASGPVPPLAHPGRRVLAIAAIVLAVTVGATVALVAARDGGNEELRAGQSAPAPAASDGTPLDERNTPSPADETKLICPPSQLDLSGIHAAPTLVPQPEGPFGPTPQPYTVRWEQDAYTVELAFPYSTGVGGMQVRSPEPVPLADGRVADVYRSASVEVHVHPPDLPLGPVGCTSFWVRIVPDEEGTVGSRLQRTPAEDTLLDIAEEVHLTAPPGSVRVPDLVGLSEIDARNVLARAGLLISEPWEGRDDGRTVTAHTPAKGADAAYGAEVVVTFSAPTTTTSPPPPPKVSVDSLPIPTAPLVCPISRLQIDGDFRSQPKIHHDRTIEWLEPGDFGGTTMMITWPSADHRHEGHGSRELTVQGRPALMHDSGDGQNLVYDTGLRGACRFLEVGVYGGQLAEREPGPRRWPQTGSPSIHRRPRRHQRSPA
ncbi:PASTA domain-containing protein [Aquihabitans daechungensis]|uniref:PASTA domain-containing protein n=1 Tax=Aquihabitans daechungensis TaxID=1052257 RepID=UPI003BA31CDE